MPSRVRARDSGSSRPSQRLRDRNADILTYAADFVRHIKSKYPDQVAAMIWYAWAMSMHNGYGLVNRSDQPIQPLNDGFRAL